MLPLFLCFFEKDFQLCHQLLMTESKPCSTFANCHMTKHVTSKGPKSTLLPENEIILVSSFQIWYLHNLRIFKDLTRSSWGPLRILLRIFMRIFKILVKIFKDPSFSCQDLQGSLIFLPRSSRIFDFLAKIFEDLWLSCQDL